MTGCGPEAMRSRVDDAGYQRMNIEYECFRILWPVDATPERSDPFDSNWNGQQDSFKSTRDWKYLFVLWNFDFGWGSLLISSHAINSSCDVIFSSTISFISALLLMFLLMLLLLLLFVVCC